MTKKQPFFDAYNRKNMFYNLFFASFSKLNTIAKTCFTTYFLQAFQN